MRIEWMALIAFVLFGGFYLMNRMGRTSPEEVRQLVADGAALVDVRTQGEFSQGHLPGAHHFPVTDLAALKQKFSDKNKPIVVYCASGARSSRARRQLMSQGYEKVFDLGPMSAW
jgi:phage shock protein E